MRDTRAAELQWREHGFGPWAIRDRAGTSSFLGCAELRLAGHGIEGIAPDEVEAGWWVTEERRKEGIATEAMEAAIDDLWGRTDVEIITAYIADGGERTISSPGRQARIRGARPRPRALGRADDGVRRFAETIGSDEDSEANGARVAWASVFPRNATVLPY